LLRTQIAFCAPIFLGEDNYYRRRLISKSIVFLNPEVVTVDTFELLLRVVFTATTKPPAMADTIAVTLANGETIHLPNKRYVDEPLFEMFVGGLKTS
jgi:hypothetical protein